MSYIKKINHVRGEYKCSRCGKDIHYGDPCMIGKKFRGNLVRRCLDCGLYDYEVTNNEWVSRIGRIVNEWDIIYEDDYVNNILKELYEMDKILKTKLKSVPKQFRNTSPSSITIKDRIRMLNESVSRLKSIEKPSRETIDEALSDLEY